MCGLATRRNGPRPKCSLTAFGQHGEPVRSADRPKRGNEKSVAQMAFERRRNKSYYYRKRRIGSRVISEYVGSDGVGALAEVMTERARAEAEAKRKEWAAIKDEQERLDAMVNDFGELATAYADAALLLAGYHQSKRVWRKRRG